MKLSQAAKLRWMIWSARIREYWLAAIIVLAAVFFLVVQASNRPLSIEITECKFVRWTQIQNYNQLPRPVAYCDLADGRTIMARITPGRSIPPAGTSVRLRVEHLVFGTRYHLL
jgi:hypothetical protein